MRFVQDGAARGLVNAAALHADQAVLDHIIQADAVAAADLVQLGDDGRSFQLFAVQLNWHALFKAGAAMADSVRTLGPGDLNHALGQDGPRKAGAEQVALVIRARLHGGDNVVVDKLVGQTSTYSLDAPLALVRSSRPSSSPFWPTLPQTAMTSQLS